MKRESSIVNREWNTLRPDNYRDLRISKREEQEYLRILRILRETYGGSINSKLLSIEVKFPEDLLYIQFTIHSNKRLFLFRKKGPAAARTLSTVKIEAGLVNRLMYGLLKPA